MSTPSSNVSGQTLCFSAPSQKQQISSMSAPAAVSERKRWRQNFHLLSSKVLISLLHQRTGRRQTARSRSTMFLNHRSSKINSNWCTFESSLARSPMSSGHSFTSKLTTISRQVAGLSRSKLASAPTVTMAHWHQIPFSPTGLICFIRSAKRSANPWIPSTLSRGVSRLPGLRMSRKRCTESSRKLGKESNPEGGRILPQTSVNGRYGRICHVCR